MSTNNAAINVQIDPIDKEEANKILKQLGINMTSFVTMAIKQLIYEQGLPFEVRAPRPNKELIESLKESEQIIQDIKSGKRTGYHDVERMFDDILKND